MIMTLAMVSVVRVLSESSFSSSCCLNRCCRWSRVCQRVTLVSISVLFVPGEVVVTYFVAGLMSDGIAVFVVVVGVAVIFFPMFLVDKIGSGGK